ncbi:hypothetical protein M0R72_11260 [Candidatus Pacearchaeota archaeon]|jgi:hypothetical protein|nr:hypothetical protein [Candidatus Pacearchaeota archaeon]
MTIILALDPAQLHDWSALAAIDMKYVKRGALGNDGRYEYDLIAMNRKQALPYDQIVEWVIKALKNPAFNAHAPPKFLLDATGVGVAINDMFRAKGQRPIAITITLGNTLTRIGSVAHLGKARLIGKFLGALDAGKVHVNPDMAIWPQVEREMLSYRAEMSAQGRVKMEAEPGENDDMLFAFAMAVWYGEEILRGARLL